MNKSHRPDPEEWCQIIDGQGDSGADVGVSASDIAALDAFALANNLPIPVVGAVPEPASVGLFVVAGIATLAQRRRRR